MKKIVSICLALLVALTASAMLASCGNTAAPPAETKAEQPTAGKVVVNFEGTVADVGENSVTLDNGQTVVFDSETVFTDASGTVENAVLSAGDYIQGYTADEPDATEITAKRVHIVGQF
ncbi:MAG: hypothetical protein IJ002_07480 [Clostridia bacterium]|nr:hypothetical protein [Clostridia bacterium]